MGGKDDRPATGLHTRPFDPDETDTLPVALMFRKGAYLPEEKTRPIQETVAALRRTHGIADRRLNKVVPAERPRQLELISA